MTRKRIYLSGPIEQSDDPYRWRYEIQENRAFYEYIDPTDHIDVTVDEMQNDPYARYYIAVECLRQITLADGVLIYWGEPEVTWGTPIEQYYAWLNGVPNVVFTEGNDVEIPGFMEVFADEIVDKPEEGLALIDRLGW